MTRGVIFDIKRFAIHDGDGIRTTLFLKGCPLKCEWCHNPEGISHLPEISLYSHKCVNCGECVSVCPVGAHSLVGGEHSFDRKKCIACGACEEVCLGSAIKLWGRSVLPEQIIGELLLDREFYETSGGGVTLSGGECLMQADFAGELLAMLKAEGISTAVDTSGLVPRESLDKVVPYTDVFLYDLKAVDPELHKKCTGRDNSLIIENLRYLDSLGKRIEIRIPFVPGRNDGEAEKMAELIDPLHSIERVRVLAYHNYAASKYDSLGMANTLQERIPKDSEIAKFRERLASQSERMRKIVSMD